MEDDDSRQAGLMERSARITQMRDDGASWLQIQEEFGLSRQQARYAYQLGKRALRRRTRQGNRSPDIDKSEKS
jgi:hypothetical protein